MSDYLVTWEIDDEESFTPYDAAQRALEIQQRLDSIATVFIVVDRENGGQRYRVDLSEDTVELIN